MACRSSLAFLLPIGFFFSSSSIMAVFEFFANTFERASLANSCVLSVLKSVHLYGFVSNVRVLKTRCSDGTIVAK